MGAKLRARLPKDSGLTPELADSLAENPRQIIALVLLNVDDVVRHIKTDTETTVLEVLSIEPVEGPAASGLRDHLTKLHEARTGESALFEIASDSPPGAPTGDPSETTEAIRQLDLYRKEEAARLREEADNHADKAEADRLNADADAIAEGKRDGELRERLSNVHPIFSGASS